MFRPSPSIAARRARASRTAPALALVLSAAALLAGADASALVDVEVRGRTADRVLPTYDADGRRWVVGEPRHEFELRLHNRSPHRVLAVVSVDGVNVVTGETAAPSQGGYVLEPWQSTTVEGWRKSLDRVAAFYFTSLPRSYAARTGRPDDVGVIGVAAFRERAPRYSEDRARPRAEAHEAPAAPAAGTAQRAPAETAAVTPKSARAADADAGRLGTGHGRRLDSRAEWTRFERASATPDAIRTLYYDSERNLVALGVLPAHPVARREPRPFPAGFVPDP